MVHGGLDTWTATTFSGYVRRAERVVYNLKRYRLLACQTAYPVIILHFSLARRRPSAREIESFCVATSGHLGWPRNIAVWLLNRGQNQHIHAGSKGTINSCFFCQVDESRYVLSALQRRVGVLWALLQSHETTRPNYLDEEFKLLMAKLSLAQQIFDAGDPLNLNESPLYSALSGTGTVFTRFRRIMRRVQKFNTKIEGYSAEKFSGNYWASSEKKKSR